ncbi:CbrC family protein [Streptomyces sp. NPDC006923]|uniref:CbrC family protein n=1 Tax=Streptomyces sp. NPDC006923 TaxID=3155355 RepID=UPI0033D5C0AE
MGRAGATELAAHPDALETFRREISYWGWPPDQIDHFLDSLDKAGQPSAYLFRCRVCAIYLAYVDFTLSSWPSVWCRSLGLRVPLALIRVHTALDLLARLRRLSWSVHQRGLCGPRTVGIRPAR